MRRRRIKRVSELKQRPGRFGVNGFSELRDQHQTSESIKACSSCGIEIPHGEQQRTRVWNDAETGFGWGYTCARCDHSTGRYSPTF